MGKNITDINKNAKKRYQSYMSFNNELEREHRAWFRTDQITSS